MNLQSTAWTPLVTARLHLIPCAWLIKFRRETFYLKGFPFFHALMDYDDDVWFFFDFIEHTSVKRDNAWSSKCDKNIKYIFWPLLLVVPLVPLQQNVVQDKRERDKNSVCTVSRHFTRYLPIWITFIAVCKGSEEHEKWKGACMKGKCQLMACLVKSSYFHCGAVPMSCNVLQLKARVLSHHHHHLVTSHITLNSLSLH